MVDAHQVQNGCVVVVDVAFAIGHCDTVVVCFPVGKTAFYAATDQQA